MVCVQNSGMRSCTEPKPSNFTPICLTRIFTRLTNFWLTRSWKTTYLLQNKQLFYNLRLKKDHISDFRQAEQNQTIQIRSKSEWMQRKQIQIFDKWHLIQLKIYLTGDGRGECGEQSEGKIGLGGWYVLGAVWCTLGGQDEIWGTWYTLGGLDFGECDVLVQVRWMEGRGGWTGRPRRRRIRRSIGGTGGYPGGGDHDHNDPDDGNDDGEGDRDSGGGE